MKNIVEIDFSTYKNLKVPDNISKTIVDLIKEGVIVILKGVFQVEEMVHLKTEIIKWGRKTQIFPNGSSPSLHPSLNYHRIDDGSIASACPHIFHQFGFNTIEDLQEPLRESLQMVANKLLTIQNNAGVTDFKISEEELRLKVLHYPQGGGFLDMHKHPLEPQRVGVILSLSEKGVDSNSGGTVFIAQNGIADTSAYHNIGDVVLFRYDLEHEVSAIDQNNGKIDWDSPKGKWSVVLELRDTHKLSHQKDN